MKLHKIKICNFRSFGNETTITIDNLSCFVGANSTGKSSALLALCKLYSEYSTERTISKNDFYKAKEESRNTLRKKELYIETIFKMSIDTNETPLFIDSYVIDTQGEDPYIRIRLEATWEDDGTLEGAVDSRIYFITCPEIQTVTENDKVNANRNVLNKIRVIYIPAIRNPNLQLKNVSGSIINRITRNINWQDTTKENIKSLITQLNDTTSLEKGIISLRETIYDDWQKYQSDRRYSEANLVFNSNSVETTMMKAEIVFSAEDDDSESGIDEMGDGLRSLFYISMIESLLDLEEKMMEEERSEGQKSIDLSAPLLTILAVEEPENHISPHLLGKLIVQLQNISQKDNAQILVTSHSPAIVKRINPEDIRYFRLKKAEYSTDVKRITLPEKEKMSEQYKFVKEAVRAYPELYFSKLVILGEGDSEELILSKFFEINGENIDISEISIVPLSGRFVNHFWRLLSDLGIPYITLLDLDRERSGGGWGRIKYALNQLINVGVDKNELLKLKDSSILSDEKLAEMHNWNMNVEQMNVLVSRLEKHKVFFSYPLDIDFVMLEEYENFYKDSLTENEGPIVKIENKNCKVIDVENDIPSNDEYIDKIENAVRQTLKEQGGSGQTYTEKQKKLMVWYNYFFLGRGKPTTHISMFSNISDEELKESIPKVIKRILELSNSLISGDMSDE